MKREVLVLGAVVMALLGLLHLTSGCTTAGRWLAADTVLKVMACVAERQDLSDASVIAECAIENVSVDDVLKILAEQRAATAKARLEGASAALASCKR